MMELENEYVLMRDSTPVSKEQLKKNAADLKKWTAVPVCTDHDWSGVPKCQCVRCGVMDLCGEIRDPYSEQRHQKRMKPKRKRTP